MPIRTAFSTVEDVRYTTIVNSELSTVLRKRLHIVLLCEYFQHHPHRLPSSVLCSCQALNVQVPFFPAEIYPPSVSLQPSSNELFQSNFEQFSVLCANERRRWRSSRLMLTVSADQKVSAGKRSISMVHVGLGMTKD